MEFVVLRSGQVIHEEAMLPGAVPARVGLPAVEGVEGEGEGEHLGLNDVDGWKIELTRLEDLLALVTDVTAQVIVRRPLGFYLGGKRAFTLDVTPGIGS